MDNASLYRSANALQRNDAANLLQDIVPKLTFTKNCRVLDVGCGAGDVTAEILLPFLPPDVVNVVGVDKSLKMINFASELYGSPRLSFHELDIEDDTDRVFQKLSQRITSHSSKPVKTSLQPIDILINGMKLDEKDTDDDESKDENESRNAEPDRFDFVFSIYCLHWVRNQRLAFANLYSLMKHGGEAILIVLAESAIFTMYQKLAHTLQWSSYMQDIDRFISPYHESEDPAGMLCDVAASSGFQVVSAECQPRTFVYRDYQALKDAIKAVNPFYPRMTSQEGENFLTDCINVVKLGNLADETDDGIVANYSIVVARLRK